ncbi:MAG: hypothetical protein JWN32_3405 [Solirubrobacterales bacterium]|nr:hypothetical protein [Solirubrobacterales bacterium]
MAPHIPSDPRTRSPRRAHRWPVLVATLATFLVVLALLAYQMRTGHDPAFAGVHPALVVSGKSGSSRPLTSRTSGAATATPAGHGGAQSALVPLTTRTSGGAMGNHDD